MVDEAMAREDLEADRSLVLRLRAGDETAFDEIYDRHAPDLLKLARRRLDGDLEQAREVLQETFFIALDSLAQYGERGSFGAWLRGIASNVVSRQITARVRDRAPARDPLSWSEALRLAQPEAAGAGLEHEALRRAVHRALDELPRRQAAALEWKYCEDLPVAEIARRLRTSEKAVESLLSRGRLAFRRCFRED